MENKRAAAENWWSAQKNTEAATAGPSAPVDAFVAMQAAQHVKPAQERATQAEKQAAEAKVVQRAAEEALEAANKAVEAAEGDARRLEEEVRPAFESEAPFELSWPGLRICMSVLIARAEPHAKT